MVFIYDRIIVVLLCPCSETLVNYRTDNSLNHLSLKVIWDVTLSDLTLQTELDTTTGLVLNHHI